MLRAAYIGAIATLLLAAGRSYADSCNFKNLNFGISQEKLKRQYQIDEFDVAAQGESIIRVRAYQICKEMPEQAIMEFSLLDNIFVQASIINENKSSELFKYATNVFGDVDNKDSATRKLQTQDKPKRGVWDKDAGYSVLYGTYNNAVAKNKQEFEKLIITSKKYQELFSKVMQQGNGESTGE